MLTSSALMHCGVDIMGTLFLYSTNPYFSYDVATKYRNSKFYAWCSEEFNSQQAAGLSSSKMIAPSSDPHNIYWQLHSAVYREDRHDPKVKQYKKIFKRLAKIWFDTSSISIDQKDEIIAVCQSISYRIWRPQLYIISKKSVESRLREVSSKNRAGHGKEFIIADLDISEFEIIELPPAGVL